MSGEPAPFMTHVDEWQRHASSASLASGSGEPAEDFDTLAEAFYDETHVMAPGKDVSAAMGQTWDEHELRAKLFREWLKVRGLRARVAALESGPNDTGPVFFYERDYYPLSNFSAFAIRWSEFEFPTSEHAYHFQKFAVPGTGDVASWIRFANSAHEAYKLAEQYKYARRPDWEDVKVDVMRDILRRKVEQHEYVSRKLLATGDRELIENSWRDDFWGWGPNRDGKNMLGKLWMEIRAELRSAVTAARMGAL